MDEHATGVQPQQQGTGPLPQQSEGYMRANHTDNSKTIIGTDWAARERQGALRLMNRARCTLQRKLRAAGEPTSPAAIRVRCMRPCTARATCARPSGNLYSRVYLAVVPGATVERAMYSFHRTHHAVTLEWLGYQMSVRTMSPDIQQRGVLAAVKTAAADGYSARS
jgi:hypothetical protein